MYFLQCEVTVTDNGYPTPKTSTSSVQISVNRLNYPTFSGTGAYSANLREDDPVGKDVVTVQAFRSPLLVCIMVAHYIMVPGWPNGLGS